MMSPDTCKGCSRLHSRASPPMAADTTPRMSWTWLAAGTWAPTHTAASAGNTRLDLVHAAVVRSDLTATRHLKDATTGARTSQTLIIGEQLAVNIDMVTGTESTGTPTMPALPAGRHAVYAVLVNSSVVDKVYDFVIPTGVLKTAVELPADSASTLGADWETAGSGVQSTGAGVAVLNGAQSFRPISTMPPLALLVR